MSAMGGKLTLVPPLQRANSISAFGQNSVRALRRGGREQFVNQCGLNLVASMTAHQSSSTAANRRYATLDGIRGLAAVSVAIFHLQQRLAAPPFNGYLAVDLFFVLSGFVLARTYEVRFKQGLGPVQFTVQRFLRFYPLYAAGFLLGVACLLFAPPPELAGLTGARATAAVLLGAVMLPTPLSTSLFPLNGAAWSLFFELAVNLLFAASLWRFRKSALLLTMTAPLLFLCMSVREPMYLNIGWQWADVTGGSARTLFSFTAGILIYRVLARVERRRSVLGLLLPLLATVPIVVVGDELKSWTLLSVGAFFPLVVALSTTIEPPDYARRWMLAIGTLSFPLYAIQWPLAALLAPCLRPLSFPIAATFFVAVALGVAYGAQRLIDEPLQALFKRVVATRRSAHAPNVFGPSSVRL